MNKHGIQINEQDRLNDKYIVLKHIASGGMSEVYLVEEINNPAQKWAVKVSNMENQLARKLVDETKLLSELHHANLPAIVDFFQTEAYFFLVMEYVPGNVLTHYIESEADQLELEQIIHIGIQLCDVLHYLHTRESPIIYRDLKPGNVIVKDDGSITLIDFGIARKFNERRIADTVRIGTVGFAAPEQFEKKQTDHRTDLFSLGALLYYLISNGKYVYVAQQPIGNYHKRLPHSLVKCVENLTALNPDDRLQDAREAKVLLLKAREEWDKRISQQGRWQKHSYLLVLILSIVMIGYFIISFIL
ncbi:MULTISPECIES: serine/threonine-protein kinase [unclassified Virgibacillus]|uniref:serine/threonine protein kinase n=1 Tax=unclassified Virgibacillus TaxID=2620237 RepID=UPI0024DE1B1B|nr:serine/threonine-protein kinase [Virgibacillus sp. LDC-1]